jgi:hypothetical protein
MSNSYVRKTDNPNMGWSDERRAKYSAQCKVAHANGTRYKKSKKAVGLAISNGKREAIKRRNRSEGQKRRHQESNVKIGHSVKVIKEILATPPPKVDDQTDIKRILEAERKDEFESEGSLWESLGVYIRSIEDVKILFDLIEDHFGFQPSLNQFMEDAIGEKLAKFKEALCR